MLYPFTLVVLVSTVFFQHTFEPLAVISNVQIPCVVLFTVNSTGAPDHGYKIGYGAPVEFTGE